MNIEEYRAMKAEIESGQKEDSTQKEQPTDAKMESTTTKQNETESPETKSPTSDGGEETKPKEDDKGETKVETIEIDGKSIPIDELRNGYLRQQDYTKKTQEVSRQRQEAEEAIRFMKELQSNPQLAQQVAQQTQTPTLDPAQQRIVDLENKYYDLKLEREIDQLTNKYSDFEVREVLEVAHEKNLTNLEDAYFLAKSRKQSNEGGGQTTPDINALKEQIRQELLKELKSEPQADTTSIIQSGGDVQQVRDTRPTLSQAEVKIAQNMGMKPEEYAKWRDAGKR